MGDPIHTLGIPYYEIVPSDWQNYGVGINPGGYLILDMGAGEEIPDGVGPDLFVEEIDREDDYEYDDLYQVSVSADGTTWYFLGSGRGDSEFDLAGMIPTARYVKVQAVEETKIDAVEIMEHTTIPSGWWRGNTHTHSDISDGDNPPAEVADHYRGRGYDFLVLSDHNKWSDFAQYSGEGLLCINGQELTQQYPGRDHVTGIGTTAVLPAGTFEEDLAAVLANGGLPHVNHPTWSWVDTTGLLHLKQMLIMEVYNYATHDREEHHWDCLLSHGKLVYGVATDDAHNLSSGAAGGWIVVRALEPTLPALFAAMVNGDFYASTGIVLDDYRALPDRIVVDSQNGELTEFIGPSGHVLQTVEGSSAEYVFDGTERYVRTRISNIRNKFAWTQPIIRTNAVDPFADDVIDGLHMGSGEPGNLLGQPWEGKIPAHWERPYALRILAGGFVTLDMGEGEEILDVDGPDLYVEEVDVEDGIGSNDPYEVEVSQDGVGWFSVGSGVGDAWFDLAGVLPQARYVKISVDSGDAEIDGVEANFPDPFADRVVESTGMTEGYPRYCLGPPYPGRIPADWTSYAVQIAVDGYLVLDLGPDEPVRDFPGEDLYIEEVDDEDLPTEPADPYDLYGSNDESTWQFIGSGFGDTSFDLAGIMTEARYLRIEPQGTDVEIDGVVVLNHQRIFASGFESGSTSAWSLTVPGAGAVGYR